MLNGYGFEPWRRCALPSAGLHVFRWRCSDSSPLMRYCLSSYTLSVPLRRLDADGWYGERPVWSGEIEAGAIRFTPPGLQSWRSRGEFDVLILLVQPELIRYICGSDVLGFPALLRPANFAARADGSLYRRDGLSAAIARHMLIALEEEDPYGSEIVRGLGHALVARALKVFGETESGPAKGGITSRNLRLVDEYVGRNLDQPLKVTDLARICCLSESHFAHAFRATTGRTPHQYVLARRIEKAKDLLRDPSRTVLDVSLECGFADASHFARAFRQLEGISPRNYRALEQGRSSDGVR